MLEAAIAGAAAGFAIAIPVGAIAVLIIQTSLTRGFPSGVAAAAGAATADGIYATIAALAGFAITEVIGSLAIPLRIVGGLVLVAIGVRGILALRTGGASFARAAAGDGPPTREPLSRTYLSLLGLTLLNPATVLYFAALTVGLPFLAGVGERLVFSASASTASLVWQICLAAFGAALAWRGGQRLRTPTVLLGNLVVIGLGLLILWEGIRGTVS